MSLFVFIEEKNKAEECFIGNFSKKLSSKEKNFLNFFLKLFRKKQCGISMRKRNLANKRLYGRWILS